MQESQRLKTLIREVSQLSVALIKGDVAHPPAAAGTTLNTAPPGSDDSPPPQSQLINDN